MSERYDREEEGPHVNEFIGCEIASRKVDSMRMYAVFSDRIIRRE